MNNQNKISKVANKNNLQWQDTCNTLLETKVQKGRIN